MDRLSSLWRGRVGPDVIDLSKKSRIWTMVFPIMNFSSIMCMIFFCFDRFLGKLLSEERLKTAVEKKGLSLIVEVWG